MKTNYEIIKVILKTIADGMYMSYDSYRQIIDIQTLTYIFNLNELFQKASYKDLSYQLGDTFFDENVDKINYLHNNLLKNTVTPDNIRDIKNIYADMALHISDTHNFSNFLIHNLFEPINQKEKILNHYYNKILNPNAQKSEQDSSESFEDSTKFLDEHHINLYHNIETIGQEKLNNLFKSYKKSLDDKLNQFDEDYENKFRNLDKKYDDIKVRYARISQEVLNGLSDLQTNIYREQLARYFLNEREKLKGNLNPLIIFFSFILSLLFYQTEIIDFVFSSQNTLFTPILKTLLLSSISLILVQIIFNLKENYSNLSTENKYKSLVILFTPHTIKELLTPYWCWLISTFTGMYFIGQISYNIYSLNTANEIKSINDILPNIPIFMAMMWFTWFSSKQFSYTKQICDEYEYKYALSKSYLSYKDEAISLSNEDKSLLVALLDSVIRNISSSPVQSVKADCHTPFSEVLNSAKNAADLVNKDKTKST